MTLICIQQFSTTAHIMYVGIVSSGSEFEKRIRKRDSIKRHTKKRRHSILVVHMHFG